MKTDATVQSSLLKLEGCAKATTWKLMLLFKAVWIYVQCRLLKLEGGAKASTWKLMLLFNPIPAGVLEKQDMLGGGQFDPPF